MKLSERDQVLWDFYRQCGVDRDVLRERIKGKVGMSTMRSISVESVIATIKRLDKHQALFDAEGRTLMNAHAVLAERLYTRETGAMAAIAQLDQWQCAEYVRRVLVDASMVTETQWKFITDWIVANNELVNGIMGAFPGDKAWLFLLRMMESDHPDPARNARNRDWNPRHLASKL